MDWSYNPDLRHIEPGKEEILLAVHARPQPTPLPAIGDVVWYRAQPFGDLVEAVVEDIQDPYDHPEGVPDPNVWYRDNVTGAPLRLLPDPWLWLKLDTVWHDPHGFTVRMETGLTTREARVRGSIGWLPYDFPDKPLPTMEDLAAIPKRFHEWRMQRG